MPRYGPEPVPKRATPRSRACWSRKDREDTAECRREQTSGRVPFPASAARSRRAVRPYPRSTYANPLLLLEIIFENLLEKFFMAVVQGLMHGEFGVSVLENWMMIAAGIIVAQHGHVNEPAERGRDGHEPLGDKLFDDALILREAFERFHATPSKTMALRVVTIGGAASENTFRWPRFAAIAGILLLVNVSVNSNVVNGSIFLGVRGANNYARQNVK